MLCSKNETTFGEAHMTQHFYNPISQGLRTKKICRQKLYDIYFCIHLILN